MNMRSVALAVSLFLMGLTAGFLISQKLKQEEAPAFGASHRDFLLQFTPLYNLASENPTQENLNRLQQVMDPDLLKIFTTNLTQDSQGKKIEPIQIFLIQGLNPYEVHYKTSSNKFFILSLQIKEIGPQVFVSQIALSQGKSFPSKVLKYYQQNEVSLKAPCPLTLSAMKSAELDFVINPFMTDLVSAKNLQVENSPTGKLSFQCLDRDFNIILEPTNVSAEHVSYYVVPLDSGISNRRPIPSKSESALQNELGLEVQESR